MTDHYYNSNPTVNSNRNKLSFTLLGNNLSFITDSGVFSKGSIDYGSRVLIETINCRSHVSVLDVGCGYGPIGISLAKKHHNITVDMIDINQRAIELTKENININNINNANAFISDKYKNIKNKYDMIVTNPPIRAGKDVVHEILEHSRDYLNRDGELWVVIQKKQGAPSAKKKLEVIFGNCEIVKRDRGYFILKSKKNDYL